jgi:hypothetical protein
MRAALQLSLDLSRFLGLVVFRGSRSAEATGPDDLSFHDGVFAGVARLSFS